MSVGEGIEYVRQPAPSRTATRRGSTRHPARPARCADVLSERVCTGQTTLAALGAGVGLSGPSVSATVLGAVPPERYALGAALNSAHQQLGTALGVATLSSLAVALFRIGLPDTVPPSATGSLKSTLTYVAPVDDGLIDQVRSSFTSAFAVTMSAAAAGCLVAAAIVWFTMRPPE